MLIERIEINGKPLSNRKVIITGAAGGIGAETAKALLYLGASVTIIDCDKTKCTNIDIQLGRTSINELYDIRCIDITDEDELECFAKEYVETMGFPDIIINNAAKVIIGAADKLLSKDWDDGYKTNLKAPILLTKYFLPGMKKRNSGVICFVPSSGAAPYMGAYEVFKTAQVEFCNTICAELENTAVYAYSIAPGLVRTASAELGIKKVAQLMGVTEESIYSSNEKNMLTVEEAGTAFAISTLLADKYTGSEIGAIQVLNDFNVLISTDSTKQIKHVSTDCIALFERVHTVFEQQHRGWITRNVFERQWVLRDFKKNVGNTPEQIEKIFKMLSESIETDRMIDIQMLEGILSKLKAYYNNQYKLLQGWERNPKKLKENSETIMSWVSDIDKLMGSLNY